MWVSGQGDMDASLMHLASILTGFHMCIIPGDIQISNACKAIHKFNEFGHGSLWC